MAVVVDLSVPGGLTEMFEGRLPEYCFLWGDPIPSGPVVLWCGHSALIGLHWECALRLATHLFHDAINAREIERGPTTPVGVDESALRQPPGGRRTL
jgi:hypothetical protein